ncbi:PIH1 domain-containing protein 1 isoform X2 [Dromaius novaehollandiae]|uniref:PIH1 domain-containing protein 1 isoform X2 n=1 Tax=Dromaius novaehollandiae TaxID=8790 RepID=UPI00311DAB4C
MAAPTDKSLLSAELEEDEEPEALRRILLQVTQGADEAETPPASTSTAVTPQPGFCVKTRAGDAKVFVNVCHSPAVPAPPPLAPRDLRLLLDSDAASAFRIPMSLGEPHAELDRSGQGCTAYDVVVNSSLLRTLQADPLYLEFFLTVVMEGLAEKYGVAVNHPGWRVLQNRKFLGSVSAQNIRTRPRPRIQELEGEEPLLPHPPSPPTPPPPAYVVVAEPSAERPRVLQARVHLPHVVLTVTMPLQL